MAGMLMVMVWMICVGSDAVEEFTPGVVTIDALTFTRVVNGRKPVLVWTQRHRSGVEAQPAYTRDCFRSCAVLDLNVSRVAPCMLGDSK